MADGAELYDGMSLTEGGDGPSDDTDNLLTMAEPKAARALVDLWTRLDPLMQHRLATWEANQLRRDGHTNVRVVKRADSSVYRVFPPPDRRGMPAVHAFNKARTLCRTFTGNLMADPPAPVVEPTSDADTDRDAAEMSQRALEDLQDAARLNTPGRLRQALDRASTYGSGFVRYMVDPAKGGRVPRTVQASPLALDADHPLVDPATGEPYGAVQLVTDPMSGQLVTQRTDPPAPVLRYIRDDNTLTDDVAEAAYEWKPGLKSEVLDGRHVRFLPWGSDRASADCVLIASFVTLREARRMASAFGLNLSKDQIKSLTAFAPQSSDYLKTDDQRHRKSDMGDEALVFCLTGIWQECPDYEDGAIVVVLGETVVLFRDNWIADVQGKREALPLPVAQVKQWENGRSDDPYGEGMMDDLGGANEVRAAQIGHLMQYLDTWNNMPLALPTTSTLTEADLYSRRVVRILPGQEPKPIKGPGYETASMDLFGLVSQEMDSASHLQQAAQGVEDPSVQSGRHAFQIISQVHAQLSEPKAAVINAYLQCCAIELALVRAFGLSGRTRWQGDDGEYKYERWEGADLGGDIRLKPGTMTMLAPGAKAELLERWMQAGIVDPESGRDMLSSNLSAALGRWDDPFLLEIKRSLAKWEDGPPEGYQPPQPQVVPGPMGPQQVMAPDPVALAIFPPKPHHLLPVVAQRRVDQIARKMAGATYEQQPPEWRAVLDAEFQRMGQIGQMAAQAQAQAEVKPGAPPKKGARTPDPAPPSPSNPSLDPQ